MKKITILGCGNMGLIYANAFIKYKIASPDHILLVEKSAERRDKLQSMHIGKVITTADSSMAESDLLILSVKPQDFKQLAAEIAGHISANTLVLSIMAGMEIASIQQALNHTHVLRAMPNSPVEIGMGMTVFTASETVAAEQVRWVENILSTTGRTLYLENESLLDAVTALSGSGPAYFYYFMQHLIQAGQEMGLDERTSATLAKQTMLGAFHLINNANKPLDELIKAVASKGGTTEAALRTFESGKMADTIVEALKNAEKRAKELATQLR